MVDHTIAVMLDLRSIQPAVRDIGNMRWDGVLHDAVGHITTEAAVFVKVNALLVMLADLRFGERLAAYSMTRESGKTIPAWIGWSRRIGISDFGLTACVCGSWQRTKPKSKSRKQSDARKETQSSARRRTGGAGTKDRSKRHRGPPFLGSVGLLLCDKRRERLEAYTLT